MRSRTITMAIASILGFASFAFAASGAEYEGSGVLLILFIGFGSLVIALQFIPGIVLLASMLKGILTPAAKENSVVANK